MSMICANCGRELVENRCKVLCPECGYFEDCSDPSAPGEWSPAPAAAPRAGRESDPDERTLP